MAFKAQWEILRRSDDDARSEALKLLVISFVATHMHDRLLQIEIRKPHRNDLPRPESQII